MSSFEVLVRRIDAVENHPGADRLSICTILGFRAITAKLEDRSHRYAPGDLIVYVPEQAVVPHDLLKRYGYWDETKGKGMLAGAMGDRVKIIKLRGEYSQGLVWPVEHDPSVNDPYDTGHFVVKSDTDALIVAEGDDVAAFFGIAKHEPATASFQSGGGKSGGIDERVVMRCPEFALTYDFDSLQKHPKFLANDEVEVTEKLHGTLTRISFRPGVNNPLLFGNGGVAITTKGQGAKGIVFKNNRANLGPRYVETTRDRKRAVWHKRLRRFPKLVSLFGLAPEPTPGKVNLYVEMAIEQGLIGAVESYGYALNCAVDLVGETYGDGVQKGYAYGQSKPVFRAFDVALDGVWLGSDEKAGVLASMRVDRVPVLWRGQFDLAKLTELRDGKTTIVADGKTKSNIREGIVITATGIQTGRERRPILKMVSPEYLMKETGEEVQ